MKRREISGSGAISIFASIAFSFARGTSSLASPQTTPSTEREPSGTSTKSPAATSSPSGTR